MSTKPKAQKTEDSTSAPNAISGSGDSVTDLSAVQNAVNAGQDVLLVGTFNFGNGQVKIRRRANITGWDSSGNRAVIRGGRAPFSVESNTQPVAIKGIVFSKPETVAIQILSVTGLVVAGCKIVGPVTPLQTQSAPAFFTCGGIVSALSAPSWRTANSGIAGSVDIDNNEIDIDPDSELADAYTPLRSFGIQLDLTGQNIQAAITIRRNIVKHVTAHGVILRAVNGTALIGGMDSAGNSEGNTITTGEYGGRVPNTQSFVDGVMCQDRGVYTVSNNYIDSGYQNSAGIRLVGTSGAIVENNQIQMSSSTPSDPVNNDESAAFELRRNCANNMIRNNAGISGQARAVLSLLAAGGGPISNEFNSNDHAGFASSLADILVGAGVSETRIDGGTGGTIQDNGTGTKITPSGNYH